MSYLVIPAITDGEGNPQKGRVNIALTDAKGKEILGWNTVTDEVIRQKTVHLPEEAGQTVELVASELIALDDESSESFYRVKVLSRGVTKVYMIQMPNDEVPHTIGELAPLPPIPAGTLLPTGPRGPEGPIGPPGTGGVDYQGQDTWENISAIAEPEVNDGWSMTNVEGAPFRVTGGQALTGDVVVWTEEGYWMNLGLVQGPTGPPGPNYVSAVANNLAVIEADDLIHVPKIHPHTESDITDLDKYRQAEVDSLLSTKAEAGHTHIEAHITNLDKYRQSEVDTLLERKSDTSHKHYEADILNLNKYTKSEVDNKDAALQIAIDANADDITAVENKNTTQDNRLMALEGHTDDGSITKYQHLPSGGQAGQTPVKQSAAEGDVIWTTPSGIIRKVEWISDTGETSVALTVNAHIFDEDHAEPEGVMFISRSTIASVYHENDGKLYDYFGPTPVAIGAGTSSDPTNFPDYVTEPDDWIASAIGAHDALDNRSLPDQHPTAAITGLDAALAGKAATGHTHLEADITDLDKYTQAQVDTALLGKSNTGHTHVEADITDLDKYTQAQVDSALAGKSNVGHGHVEADISDLDKYTQVEVDSFLAGKSDTGHQHVEADITDLDKYDQSVVDSMLVPKLNSADFLNYTLVCAGMVVANGNGTGAPQIRRERNIAGVTRQGQGLYRVTLNQGQMFGVPISVDGDRCTIQATVDCGDNANNGDNADVVTTSIEVQSDLVFDVYVIHCEGQGSEKATISPEDLGNGETLYVNVWLDAGDGTLPPQ